MNGSQAPGGIEPLGGISGEDPHRRTADAPGCAKLKEDGMGQLRQFKDLEIDWNMAPEDAVALYLEWGNTGYGGSYENRVKSKNDYSNYFVVYNWDEDLKACLVRRNSDGAEDLACLPIPDDVSRSFRKELGTLKGVYKVDKDIRRWLEAELYG